MEDWEKKAKAAAEHVGLENHQVILNAVWKDDLPRYYTGWVKHKMTNFNWIWTLEYYREGERNGFMIEWHENGQKFKEGNYKEGKRDGLWTEWYENAQKKKESNYKDGKLSYAKVWLPNGEKCDRTSVMLGAGVLYEYNNDGTLDKRVTYEYGFQSF